MLCGYMNVLKSHGSSSLKKTTQLSFLKSLQEVVVLKKELARN
jgi:hypothetical protein